MAHMKKLLLLIFTIIFTLPLFAVATTSNLPFVEGGVLIPLDNELYWKMDALFVIAGKAVPSTSRPWTVAEARTYLSLIDPQELTAQESKSNVTTLYQDLYTCLYPKNNPENNPEDQDTLSLTLTLAPEAYAHTNDNYNREEYWNYGYSKRSHLAIASLDNATHGLYGHLELSVGKGLVSQEDAQSAMTIKEYTESLGKTWGGIGTLVAEEEGDNYTVITTQKAYTDKISSNLPLPSSSADLNMPRRYYLDYANSFMSLGVYKAQKTWGYNKSGNFIFDSHNDYYHTATLKTYSKKFNFEYTLMQPEAYKGGSNYYLDDGQSTHRLFAAHRIELRLLDRLNVVLSENTMYQFAGFLDATLISPANFYHNNVNNLQFNSLAHVEFEWSVAPGWLVYGSWVIDQGSFPGFEDRTTEDQAMGYSLGAEYDTFLLGGLARFSFEALYTNPALYRPTVASDFIVNYNATFNGDESYFRYPFYTYLGYKYGGDTISLRLDANFRKAALYLYGTYELRFDGTFTLYDKYTQPLLLCAPSGNFDVTFTFNLGAQYQLTLFETCPVTAFLDLTLLHSQTRGLDVQLALGASIAYTLSTT